MQDQLNSPFWAGFRKGVRQTVWLSIPFALFALAMTNNPISMACAILSLLFAVFANVVAYTRLFDGCTSTTTSEGN